MTKSSRAKADISPGLRVIAAGLAIANVVYAAHYARLIYNYGFDPVAGAGCVVALGTAVVAMMVSRGVLRKRVSRQCA